MKFAKLSLVVIASSIICACSSYSVSTNLDPENFTGYFKPSAVDEMTQEQIAKVPALSKGMVKGFSCQLNESDFIATESDARTDAKIKAADIGANAIIFGKCVRVRETSSCLESVTCYGEAYVVDSE